jgi:hypothetical protein
MVNSIAFSSVSKIMGFTMPKRREQIIMGADAEALPMQASTHYLPSVGRAPKEYR